MRDFVKRLLATLVVYLVVGPTMVVGQNPAFWGTSSRGLVRNGLVGVWNLGSVNLLKWSEDFSNAAWVGSSTGFSSSAYYGVAPNNRSAYTLVTKSSTNPGFYQNVGVIGITTTLAFDFKPGTAIGSLYLGDLGNFTPILQINAATGEKVLGTGTSTALPGGWFRAEISGTWTPGSTMVGLFLDGAHAAGETIIVSALQYNEGPVALPYQATTDLQRVPVGLTGSMPMRREIGGAVVYDPAPDAASKFTYADGSTRAVTGTNLLTYSEALDNAAWVSGGSGKPTVTANTEPCPDGSTGADTLTYSSAQQASQLVSIFPNTSYTVSAWIKSLNGSTTTNIHLNWRTIADASISDPFVVQAITTSWVRYSYSGISPANAELLRMRIGDVFPNTLVVCGAQLNPGTLPDVYVKTEGVALKPGYPFLQLGSTSGVDTNDPVRRLAGMVFATDDYLTGPTITTNTQAFTATAVLNPSTNNNAILDIGVNPRFTVFTSSVAAGGYWNAISAAFGSTAPLTDGAWVSYGLQAGVSGAGSHLNGTLTSGAALAASVNSGSFTVGKEIGSSAYFNGTISHVGIWSRALNAREVRQNHQWYRTDMNPKLALSYTFDTIPAVWDSNLGTFDTPVILP